MEYCGLRKGHPVRAATKAGRSRSGKETKPRSAHSRRSCYRTADKGLSNKACMMGESGRCVIHGKNPASLERSRSRSRSKYVPHPRVKKVREVPETIPSVPMTAPSKLTTGPYSFEFMVDTDLRGTKKNSVEDQVVNYYLNNIKKYEETQYKLVDSFEVDHMDDNLYQATLTMKSAPKTVSDLEELIDSIISPTFAKIRVPVYGDLLEETLTLNGLPLVQNGGRYYYSR